MALTTSDPFSRLKALQRPAASSSIRQAGAQRSKHGADDDSSLSDSVAKRLGGTLEKNEYGEYVKISQWFAEPQPVAVEPATLHLLRPDAEDVTTDLRQWVFLDTETTGLAGGTGTYAFLVGIAWWDGIGLQVEQYFMRDLNEELPVLSALANRIDNRRVLITFNGKCFDWPLLQTRYRMTRKISVPEPIAHFDFLHPARNLWRLRLGSVRLAELERHVLGWDRGADIPSDLIPGIYLDFIRGGAAEPLVPIIRHNQMDLRSLAALSTHVLSLLADPEEFGRDPLEVYGASRIYERSGEPKRARSLYEHAIASSLPVAMDRAARMSVALLAKRAGDYSVAVDHWGKTAGTSKEGFRAYEELAIYYEHRRRESQRALEITRDALSRLRDAYRLSAIAPTTYRHYKSRFEHRLARLEGKCHAPLLHLVPLRDL